MSIYGDNGSFSTGVAGTKVLSVRANLPALGEA